MLTAPAPKPVRRKWTRSEFYRVAQLGLFQCQRVQLIEGEIIQMPAQSNVHAATISLVEDALEAAFGPGFWIRNQYSLDLTPHSVPDPDLAVVSGSPRGSGQDNPTTALLVVEVSDTTLNLDRRRKASLYALAGIPDYWIVNLRNRQLEVHRGPTENESEPFGHGYSTRTILRFTDEVSPLAAPQSRIKVADLFP